MPLLGTLYTSPSKEHTLPLNRPSRTLVLLSLVGLIRASESDLYWFVLHPLTAAIHRVGSINYTVTSTNATWFHCTVPGHCQAGMVFAVNPGSQFSAFQSAAMGNTSSSSTPSSSNGTSHTVIVGSGLTFSPSNITASPGDTVTFDFQQGDHSATQSTFAGPCQSKSGGFDSG